MNFGTRNELHHYNKRIRNERMAEIAARLFWVGAVVYLTFKLLEKMA